MNPKWEFLSVTPQVQAVLAGYSTSSPSVRRKIARLLNHGTLAGTGRVVILPVDQGIVHGPWKSFRKNVRSVDPLYLYELATKAGMSAYAAPLGALAEGAGLVDFLTLPIIAKVNHEAQFFKPREPYPALSGDPKRVVEQAVELGCDGVGMTIYYGTEHQTRNVEVAAAVFDYAHQLGMFTVAWAYPRGTAMESKEQSLEVTGHAVYCSAVELRADIIKVKPPKLGTTDEEKEFDTLAKQVAFLRRCALDGRRMVIFSGMEKADEATVIESASQIASGGGSGMIIGRNSFKRSLDEACVMISGVAAEFRKAAAA